MVLGGTQQDASTPGSQTQSSFLGLAALASLIGCGGRTDVSSLMIFVTIKLIVVYGSEMQECGGKGSRLMDREVGDVWEGSGGVIMG